MRTRAHTHTHTHTLTHTHNAQTHICAQLDIDSVEKYEELRVQEQNYFKDMVKRCKDSGAGLIVCQWGFDDEANHLLMHHDLPAIRCGGGECVW